MSELSTTTNGKVYLIGAGPGDPGLLTLRARDLIRQADVVVYDYLVHPDILQHAQPEADMIYVGKKAKAHTLPQGDINALLVDLAQQGKTVVRLKGGDPYVFGRGGEEAQQLQEARVSFEVVPGITSGIAAPMYAGIPVTHRDCNTAVTFITGHEDPNKGESTLNWKALASLSRHGTLVFYMAVERLGALMQSLLDECADPTTPVALVRWGTLGRQESLEGTIATIAEIVRQRGFKAPAITIVGQVVKYRRELNWFESRPLFGQRIVVTRTRQQASRLSQELRLLGAEVIEIPTIRIVPTTLTAEQTQQLSNLTAHFDWLVFTSPNGVEHFFARFFEVNDDIRALGQLKFAAVGPATAAKLKALGLHCDLTPRTFTTEELGRAFTPEQIQDQRFCLARSALGNPELATYLQKQGGQIAEWSLYDTLPETDDPFGKQQDFRENGADYLTFTSSSTVENWHALQLSAPADRQPKHVSIGPVTSQTLKALNLSLDIEATTHTIPGLIQAILENATHPTS